MLYQRPMFQYSSDNEAQWSTHPPALLNIYN